MFEIIQGNLLYIKYRKYLGCGFLKVFGKKYIKMLIIKYKMLVEYRRLMMLIYFKKNNF